MEILFYITFGTALVVAPIAWLSAVVHMVLTITNRKPGVRLWYDAPFGNPCNHVFMSEHLTESGLPYRRRLWYSIVAFLASILLALLVGAVAGKLR